MSDGLIVVVAGVAGSGKTTIGRLLADRLRLPYAEADDFHPPANIAKMSSGVPLTDDDRAPWLDAIAHWIDLHRQTGAVVTCSALKRKYRDRLSGESPTERASRAQIVWIQLTGSEELLRERMVNRSGHFMPPALLKSQLNDLEPLQDDEQGAAIDVDKTPEEIVDAAIDVLAVSSSGYDNRTHNP